MVEGVEVCEVDSSTKRYQQADDGAQDSAEHRALPQWGREVELGDV